MTLAILVFLAQLLASFSGPSLRHVMYAAHRRTIEDAMPNDNRVAAGRLINGVLTIELEAREVLWRPDGAAGGTLPVYAFAEVGRPAQIPGPMIRVSAGSEIQASVRNTLRMPLRFRGLQDHSSGQLDTVVVAPDSTLSFRFRADVGGTYYYFARTSEVVSRPILPGVRRDAALTGAFIVDSAGSKPRRNERVLLINFFLDTVSALGHRSEAGQRALRREFIRDRWFTITVNGLSWPHTERLAYTVGDTVHWRVINAGAVIHPMHLHGFYFDVDSRGFVASDTIYTAAQRRKAVTEPLPGGTTMSMTWVPTRPGNWLFHCHIVTHIDPALRLGEQNEPAPAKHTNHAEQGMAALVMGIYVKPAKGVVLAGDPRPRKKLRLYVTERANVYGDRPGLSYILQEGSKPPGADSIRIPSSTIFLRQHEPTEITVVNRAKTMATVHWHGIEVESVYDGVGDWSGWGTRVAPAIAPGDSFVVRMTPDRAGTFIYHAHTDEGVQLASGLFGTLIVLPEKGERDTTERVFLFGIGGPNDEALPTINGSSTPAPPPIDLHAGVPHRFRFINISPLEIRVVQLLADTVRQEWRAVAKDGADLPPEQARMRAATVLLEPGETFDFEVLRQRSESLTLQVESPQTIAVRAPILASGVPRAGIPRLITKIPVVVR